MGRRKKYSRRFLIGLDKIQAQTIVNMAEAQGLTYSEVIGYMIDRYLMGK